MTNEITKALYSAPQVVEFGSVRNLTGGSNTLNRDAGDGMMRN
jgi:hypothetical protein